MDRPDAPEDTVVEEDECGHGAEAGGQEARPVDVVADVVGVVAQVSHAVVNLRTERKKRIIVGDVQVPEMGAPDIVLIRYIQ